MQLVLNNVKTAKMALVLMKKRKAIGVQITNFKRDGNAIVTNDYSKVGFDVNVSEKI